MLNCRGPTGPTGPGITGPTGPTGPAAVAVIFLQPSIGWTSETQGANQGQNEFPVNKVNTAAAQFASGSQSFWEISDILPGYNGGDIRYQVCWFGLSADVDSVKYSFQAQMYANGDAIDQAFGAAVFVTQTNAGNGDENVTPLSGPVVIRGRVAGNGRIQFKLGREATAAPSSDFAHIAQVTGVLVFYTRA